METMIQPKVTGYRQLTATEAALMNEIKAEGATVLYVGRYGALSLAQPSLLERDRQQQLPGTN